MQLDEPHIVACRRAQPSGMLCVGCVMEGWRGWGGGVTCLDEAAACSISGSARGSVVCGLDRRRMGGVEGCERFMWACREGAQLGSPAHTQRRKPDGPTPINSYGTSNTALELKKGGWGGGDGGGQRGAPNWGRAVDVGISGGCAARQPGAHAEALTQATDSCQLLWQNPVFAIVVQNNKARVVPPDTTGTHAGASWGLVGIGHVQPNSPEAVIHSWGS